MNVPHGVVPVPVMSCSAAVQWQGLLRLCVPANANGVPTIGCPSCAGFILHRCCVADTGCQCVP